MSLNGVCIRSVFEQKIGPYKVCIFVNMGPYGKVAALHPPDTHAFSRGCQRQGFFGVNSVKTPKITNSQINRAHLALFDSS